MSVHAILLAAGASRRMGGRDKLTEPAREGPLIRDRAEMLMRSGVDGTVVVLPDTHPERAEALDGLTVETVANPDASSGMASSIRVGIAALPSNCKAALIMPADLPDLTSQDIDLMLSCYAGAPDLIHRATSQTGQPGSPVIFPRPYFAELSALQGEESGRVVLARHSASVRTHALPDDHATLDLDTPEAWAAWRARSL